MDKNTWIIPARFDHKEAAAGLKAIEQSGRAAEDLGHAADSASDRFRRAHVAVQSATRGYLELQRALGSGGERGPGDSAPSDANSSGPRPAAALRPEDWNEPADVRRGRAGIRSQGDAAHSMDEPPADGPRERHPSAAEARQAMPATSGAADGSPSGRGDLSASVAAEMGASRVSGPTDDAGQYRPAEDTPDGLRPLQAPGVDVRSLRGDGPALASASGQRVSDAGTDPIDDRLRGDGSFRSRSRGAAGEAASLFDRGPSGDPRFYDETRSTVDPGQVRAISRERTSSQEDGSAGLGDEGVPEGFNLRGSARRMRASFPAGLPAEGAQADGSPPWGGTETAASLRQDSTIAQQGGLSQSSAIERLLREQNELIRQDMDRNASPPLAAPPPMRGGGIRMGS